MSDDVKPRRRGLKLILLAVLAAGVYLYLRNCAWLGIDAIEVYGNDQVLAEELISMSGLQTGQNILAVDLDEASRALSYHPLVKQVEISRRFPKKVAITVQERHTWAVVRYKDTFLCLDEEGYCLDKQPSVDITRYVLISFDELPAFATLGRPFQPAAIKAIRTIWEGLTAEERDSLSEFYYTAGSGEVTIYTVGGTEIRYGDDSRPGEKMDLLKKSLAMEQTFKANNGQAIEYIDLRFKGQPVIKTKS